MSKIVMINSVPYGSPAKIMYGIAEIAKKEKYEVLTATGYSTHPAPETPKNNVLIGGFISKSIHMIISRFTGKHGCYSMLETMKFIRFLRKAKPEIIHIHNIHGWFINIPMLFRYIKKHHIRVIWTLHDCWSFTGQCPYFTIVDCKKWKTGCYGCNTYREYPQSYIDRTKKMWRLKRDWFLGIDNLTLVTPSKWLADLVKESFLGGYPVKIINNGIDLNIYHPTESNFREKYKISNDKKIILGVALGWGTRKGLDVFLKLEQMLPNKYQIVLVGTDDSIDKKLSNNIISIHRTQSQKELAEIYTAADLFINPTREENYPTVNMEAIACGTPVLTFETGGSPEIIDEHTGSVVVCNDIDAMKKEIIRICENDLYKKEICTMRGLRFDMNKCFEKYIELYRQ